MQLRKSIEAKSTEAFAMGVPGLFITGTDTGVGKTHVAAAIVGGFVDRGLRVGVYKPVATGFATPTSQESDAWILWRAAGSPQTPLAVCPQSFAAPVAPPASARLEGRSVDERLLRTGLEAWLAVGEVVVVEGVGGLFSPVGDQTLVVDLAREFTLPVVVVDSARLGAIGRTLAVVRAARAEGLQVAAVVLSHGEPMTDADSPASPQWLARTAACEITGRTGLRVAILDHAALRMPPDTDWLALARGQTLSPEGALDQ